MSMVHCAVCHTRSNFYSCIYNMYTIWLLKIYTKMRGTSGGLVPSVHWGQIQQKSPMTPGNPIFAQFLCKALLNSLLLQILSISLLLS